MTDTHTHTETETGSGSGTARLTLPAELLAATWSALLPIASSDTSRPVMTGLAIAERTDGVHVTTTDAILMGHVVIPHDLVGECVGLVDTLRVVAPVKATDVRRLAKGAKTLTVTDRGGFTTVSNDRGDTVTAANYLGDLEYPQFGSLMRWEDVAENGAAIDPARLAVLAKAFDTFRGKDVRAAMVRSVRPLKPWHLTQARNDGARMLGLIMACKPSESDAEWAEVQS